MTLSRLVLREIRHRTGAFLLSVLSVAAAVATVVGAIASLEGFDAETAAQLEKAEEATAARAAKMEDDYRRIMKELGYNLLILHEDVDLADFQADDFASSYLPEEYADRLAESPIITVNHLMPSLLQKVKWPEKERTIQLIGTKGQVPIQHRSPKKPIEDAVAPDAIVLGFDLAQKTELSIGDETQFFGRELKVADVHARRGDRDDITAWIHLDVAQEILGKEGLITGIRALECDCPGDAEERLATITAEIRKHLPNTKVVPLNDPKRIARAEARRIAKEAGELSVESVRAQRQEMRASRESVSELLALLVVVGGVLSVGFFALLNARSRAVEVGILRAIGLERGQIFRVLLARAALAGIAGAVIGVLAGALFGAASAGRPPVEGFALAGGGLIVILIVAAPALAMVAAWIPAQLTATEDPAVVLRYDD